MQHSNTKGYDLKDKSQMTPGFTTSRKQGHF